MSEDLTPERMREDSQDGESLASVCVQSFRERWWNKILLTGVLETDGRSTPGAGGHWSSSGVTEYEPRFFQLLQRLVLAFWETPWSKLASVCVTYLPPTKHHVQRIVGTCTEDKHDYPLKFFVQASLPFDNLGAIQGRRFLHIQPFDDVFPEFEPQPQTEWLKVRRKERNNTSAIKWNKMVHVISLFYRAGSPI